VVTASLGGKGDDAAVQRSHTTTGSEKALEGGKIMRDL
jgi:hypothetical protein